MEKNDFKLRSIAKSASLPDIFDLRDVIKIMLENKINKKEKNLIKHIYSRSMIFGERKNRNRICFRNDNENK